MKTEPHPHPVLIPAAIGMLLIVVFAIDLSTPLGYAEWALYMVPIGLTLMQRNPSLPAMVALLATVLTVIGYYASPTGLDDGGTAAINRSLGVLSGWVLAIGTAQTLVVRRRLDTLLWQQEGHGRIAEAMLGDATPEQVGERASQALCNVLGAEVGVLYRLDGARLMLCGAYAADVSALPADIDATTGMLAEAMRAREPRVLDDLPAPVPYVATALFRAPPSRVALVPVMADRHVVGVIELGFVAAPPLTLERIALLRAAGDAIGIALRSALYRRDLIELLEETQRQSEELQAQQEELRVANEELEQQSRVLAESQVRLEQQQADLERTNAELEEQAATLEQQKHALEANASALEQASRYKSEFLANMSHELRTPLNSALILSRLLAGNKEGNLTPQQVEYAQTIHSANNDLLALINDILDLSKIEAGRVELDVRDSAVDDVLERLRATFAPIAAQRGLRLAIERAGAAPSMLRTDPLRLQQVLTNLLANALKFTERGEVRLTATADGDGIAFAVSDTGVGIARDQHALIFEAFRQADGGTSRRYGGTGLGLSISRQLARRLGGDITLDSAPGRGSVFTLRVPHAGPSVEPPAPRAELPVPLAAASDVALPADDRDARTRPERLILAIEDDAAFASALLDIAHELDFDCVLAATGAEGLRLARDLQPVGILLDVGLPDQSGLGVLEQLKRDPSTRHVPVHMVSAYERTQSALELGAIGYLHKPTTPEQLVRAFRQLEQRVRQTLKRLLIVEDDATLRGNLQLLLAGDDVEITAVGTIADALDALRRAPVDCLVTDLSLPDGSGFELLEQLAAGNHGFPPVIVYTGRALDRDEEQRLRRYSQSIIVKGARSPERLLDEVTLFLHSVEARLPPNQRDLLQQARQRDAVLDGRCILLAEDDVRNVFALTGVFEPLGARLAIARNGREALDRLRAKDDVDLVLMDVMMPEMDGLAAMRAIRARPEWAQLPVIALTAKAMPEDRERCIEAGANDYIAKPIDVDKLVSLCRVWMPK